MKKFFAKLWQQFKTFFGAIPAELQKAVHIGVQVTDNLKKFVDSPAADILTAVIPGTVDDRIKVALRQALPGILAQLKLADAVANLNDPEEITAAAVKTLQSLSGDLKSAFLHNLSILIAQVAADGKLTWQDGAYIMEWYYQNKKTAA
jgi:hypothetical protein